MHTAHRSLLTASGHRCPATGHWQSLTPSRERVALKEGDAVPLQSGQPVYWVLHSRQTPDQTAG